MKTIILSVPAKKEPLLNSFLKRNRFKSRVVTDEDLEDAVLAKWIDEGMKSADIPLEKIYELLERNGAIR